LRKRANHAIHFNSRAPLRMGQLLNLDAVLQEGYMSMGGMSGVGMRVVLRYSLFLLVLIALISVGLYGNRGVPNFRQLAIDKVQVLFSLPRSVLSFSPVNMAILCVTVLLVITSIADRKKRHSSKRA
jgi:hypothetical protein